MVNETRRRIALAGLTALLPRIATAEQYPVKPIHLVVPWPAGGVADVVTRRLAPHLEKIIGQPCIVENRAGMQGQVGLQTVARAVPDGYTVARADNTSLIIGPSFATEPLFDSQTDFSPISLDGRGFLTLVIPSSVPARTLQEFIEHAKSRPGELNYAGLLPSAAFLCMERLKELARIDLRMVAYKGDSYALTDLVAGHVQGMFAYVTVAAPLVQNGKLRALMVTGEKRAPALSEVPTARELGMPEMVFYGWGGYMAPRGTPQPIIDTLSSAVRKATQTPEVLKAMNDSGSERIAGTPEEFRAYLKAESDRQIPFLRSLKARIGNLALPVRDRLLSPIG